MASHPGEVEIFQKLEIHAACSPGLMSYMYLALTAVLVHAVVFVCHGFFPSLFGRKVIQHVANQLQE